MDTKLKRIISVLCVLVISGLAAANCGKCGSGDKKACPADCQKACCQKADAKKACPADCQKACCQKADAKKACPADCQKACCQKADAKKACPADCQKACCQKADAKKACPADCQKACCQKADAKKACRAGCQKACCKALTAPDFTLKDLSGKEFQLSKLKDKIVVLEWTNYDCPFVQAHYDAEAKTMSLLAKKYAKKDVVWLTVNSTHYATTETNRAWADKHKLKRPVLMDSDGKVGKLYKAKTTPHLFIIDKKGKIAYQGAIDNTPLGKKPEGAEPVNYVDQALSELLAGKAVSTPKTKPYGCSVKYAKSKDG